MHPDLQEIKEAAEGLLYASESDYPFEAIQLPVLSSSLENELIAIAGQLAGAPIEKTTLPYFFRNAVKVYPESSTQQRETAQRFLRLQNVLQEKLRNIEVYRIGRIRIDVFIIGQLADAAFAGLRTKVIET